MEKSAYISNPGLNWSVESMASTQIVWLDLLRFLAIVGVLFIHVSAPVLYAGNPGSYPWWVAALFDSISRPAVPLFIMVSGALLLSSKKTESILSFYKKRVLKLIIPLLAWSFIYSYLVALHHHQSYNVVASIKAIIAGPVMYHLGFMYVIVGLYLVTPIVRSYLSNATLTNQFYFLGLWFAINCLKLISEGFFHMQIGIQFEVVTGFIGYYLAGYLIFNNQLFERVKSLNMMLAMIFISMLIITMSGTYFLSLQKGNLDEFFYEYLSPNIIIMAFCLFVLIKNVSGTLITFNKKYSWLEIALKYFRQITFGVYFAHVLVMHIFYSKLHFSLVPVWPIITIPLLVLFFLLATASLVTLLRQIPLLKWLAP